MKCQVKTQRRDVSEAFYPDSSIINASGNLTALKLSKSSNSQFFWRGSTLCCPTSPWRSPGDTAASPSRPSSRRCSHRSKQSRRCYRGKQKGDEYWATDYTWLEIKFPSLLNQFLEIPFDNSFSSTSHSSQSIFLPDPTIFHSLPKNRVCVCDKSSSHLWGSMTKCYCDSQWRDGVLSTNLHQEPKNYLSKWFGGLRGT